MKTVLVTGGSGFIGSNLCEKLLVLGYNVINLDNFNDYYSPLIKIKNIKNALENKNYKVIDGDIQDKNLLTSIFNLNRVDIIIHLAALAGVRRSLNNPLEYIDVDIKGTVNLLECARKYNTKKFIFASSSSVYGHNFLPFKETDTIASQISPYAAAKASGELFCKTFNNLYDIPIVCLRFFTVYGPRQRPEMAIYNFTSRISEGRAISIFGNGTSSRDYTFIDDILDGIVSSMNLNCSFEIFNLGNSNPTNIEYLVTLIEENLGKKALIDYTLMQPGDVPHTFADISKAQSLINYAPKVSIEKGIEEFINWFKVENK
ncbi:GDP-mannose 4,6-dehydratase [Candidatus Clostridium radicumherbarum]|uniref:GDP-mannose 4,6-dehydratase n=1 Tax=Candidatus Clostridium radicumherbarum TaxID=3381662 RepID=A0ABW8TW61_9CLOT